MLPFENTPMYLPKSDPYFGGIQTRRVVLYSRHLSRELYDLLDYYRYFVRPNWDHLRSMIANETLKRFWITFVNNSSSLVIIGSRSEFTIKFFLLTPRFVLKSIRTLCILITKSKITHHVIKEMNSKIQLSNQNRVTL